MRRSKDQVVPVTGSSLSGSGWVGMVGRLASVALVGAVLAACSSADDVRVVSKGKIDPRYGVAASPRVVGENDPVPPGGGRYMTGKPYRIGQRWFTPMDNPAGYEAVGMASWYGSNFHGRRTANGEVFDSTSISAAHPTLPLPCYVRVTNLDNGRSIVVRVNDRGPYHGRRLVDVSHDAANILGFKGAGVARVKIKYVGPAKLEGSDRNILLASYRGPQDMRPAPDTPAGARDVLIASADRRPADFGWGSAGKPALPAAKIDLGRNRDLDPQSRPLLASYMAPANVAPRAAGAAPVAPVSTPRTTTLAAATPSSAVPVPQQRPQSGDDAGEGDGFYLTANAAERAARGGTGDEVAAAAPEDLATSVDLAAPVPRANPHGAIPFGFTGAPAAAPAPAAGTHDAISDLLQSGNTDAPATPRPRPASGKTAALPVPAPVNAFAAEAPSRFDAIDALLAAEAGTGAATVPFKGTTR